jgi:hypothetical protein
LQSASRDAWAESSESASELEGRLDALTNDQSPAADEASVILLDYHLGEHNAELQLCAVTKRGKRVLPILAKYEGRPAGLIKPQYALLRLNKQSRKSMYREALVAIRNGQQLCD